MSIDDCRGSAWAFRRLMAQAKADIDAGVAKPARVIAKRRNPAKTDIGLFKARLLRLRRQA